MVSSVTCAACGTPSSPGDSFCMRCGTSLGQPAGSPSPAAPERPAAAVAAPRPAGAALRWTIAAGLGGPTITAFAIDLTCRADACSAALINAGPLVSFVIAALLATDLVPRIAAGAIGLVVELAHRAIIGAPLLPFLE